MVIRHTVAGVGLNGVDGRAPLERVRRVDAGSKSAYTGRLGLHVILVTRGNEAAAAPVARQHCTQEKRITHG